MHNSVHSAGSTVPTTPILVVGAGPAGATAARTLAAAGLPVCLLDRSSFPAEQTVRRRDQHARPDPLSVPRAGAAAHRDAHGRASAPRRARRSVDDHRVGRSGGADDPARRIRRAARVARRRGRRRAGAGRRHRAGAAGRGARRARRARRPAFRGADRRRGGRRAQRHRAAARAESGMARLRRSRST